MKFLLKDLAREKLDKSGIHVAQYFTELLPRKVLEKKLHDTIRLARERLAAREQLDKDSK